ncbi:MAG: hypothetical protein NVS2B16_18610 [Chloroflexota bacterium]
MLIGATFPLLLEVREPSLWCLTEQLDLGNSGTLNRCDAHAREFMTVNMSPLRRLREESAALTSCESKEGTRR